MMDAIEASATIDYPDKISAYNDVASNDNQHEYY